MKVILHETVEPLVSRVLTCVSSQGAVWRDDEKQ
jgi:hypothetical protein